MSNNRRIIKDAQKQSVTNKESKKKYQELPAVTVLGKKKYDILPTAQVVGKMRFIPPSAERDNTAAPFLLPNGQYSNTGNLGLSRRQLGKHPGYTDVPLDAMDALTDYTQFIPGPAGTAAEYLGMAIDGYQAYDAFKNKRYIDGAVNTASALLPMLPKSTYRTLGNILETGYDTYNALNDSRNYRQQGGSIPKAQKGGNINLGPIPYQETYMGRPALTVAQAREMARIEEERKKQEDKQIVEDRKKRIKASEEARKRPLSAQQFADETQATGDKFRLFPNDPHSFIDDWINPGVFIGNLASGLGRVPLNVQQGNYGQAALDVAMPALMGAGEKLLEPVIKRAGNYLTTQTALKNAYKLNPWAFKVNPEAYYRGIGEDGLKDAIESGLFRSPTMRKSYKGIYKTPETYWADANNFRVAERASVQTNGSMLRGKRIIAEYPKTDAIKVKYRGPNNEWIDNYASINELPISEGKIYKQDWLRGYKPIETPSVGRDFKFNNSKSGLLNFLKTPGEFNPVGIASDHSFGLLKGAIEQGKGFLGEMGILKNKGPRRPFFETFPVTKAQRDKVMAIQDQAMLDAQNFTNEYWYGNGQDVRPVLEEKMRNILPELKVAKYINNLERGNSPISRVPDRLIRNTTWGEGREGISQDMINYLNRNRGRIGGVNNDEASITLRNNGFYYKTPREIANTVAHESGHSAQDFGAYGAFDRNPNTIFDYSKKTWGEQLAKFDPNYDYYTSNPDTEIGRRFQEALVNPKKSHIPGKMSLQTWRSSPNELHSELMASKYNLYKQGLRQGYTPEQMMEKVVNPGEKELNWLLNNKSINKHFKKGTSLEEKLALLKILPAAVPVVGAAALTSQEQKKKGGVITDPRGQWAHPGKVTKIPSNQITMQGVPYPVLGVSDLGHAQMMYPGQDYNYYGSSVTEYPMMQKGGRTPIYVDNPNGPQLKSKTPEQGKSYDIKKAPAELLRAVKEFQDMPENDPQIVARLISVFDKYKVPKIKRPDGAIEYNLHNIDEGSKQSVQKPERVLTRQTFKGVPYNIAQPQINVAAPIGRSIEQYPTNYSVTFRDENSPSHQRTQYFPDLQSWRNFTDNAGYMSREQTSDGKSAQALGYNTNYKQGGEMMQNGGDYTGPSIVDYLTSKGYKSDKKFRKGLAEKYGVEDYNFSAEKNLELLSKLRKNDDLLEQNYEKSFAPVSPEQIAETIKRNSRVVRSVPVEKKYNRAQLDLMMMNPSLQSSFTLPKSSISANGTGRFTFGKQSNYVPIENENYPVQETDVEVSDEQPVFIEKQKGPVVKTKKQKINKTPPVENKAGRIFLPSNNVFNNPGWLPTSSQTLEYPDWRYENVPVEKQTVVEKPKSVKESSVVNIPYAVPYTIPVATSEGLLDPLKDFYNLGKNYVTRTYYKHFGDDEKTATSLLVVPKTGGSKIKDSVPLPPPIIQGDPIWDNKDRVYHAPEVIDLSRTKWGYRNRGDRNEVNSAGYEFGVIDNPSNRRKIVSSKNTKLENDKVYVGIDKNGNMKSGTGDMFKDQEYHLGQFTHLKDVVGFQRDKNGDYVFEDASGAAGGHVTPKLINSEGATKAAGLLIKKNSNNNYKLYGNITGGHIIITSPDYKKQVLISGSLTDIATQMNKFMKDNNLPKVNFIQLDNGSYSRNYKTKDKKITAKDWQDFDYRNSAGGSGFYLQGNGYQAGGQKNVFVPPILAKESTNVVKVFPSDAEMIPGMFQQTGKSISNYFTNWMNSPMYKQMIKKSDPDLGDEITKRRFNNLNNLKINYFLTQPKGKEDVGAYADTDDNITILPLGFDTKGTPIHEGSHVTDNPLNHYELAELAYLNHDKFYNNYGYKRLIPYNDVELMQSFANGNGTTISNDFNKYVAEPTETRARLNNIRAIAYKNKLYNPFTEKVSPEIYKKLKDFKFEDNKNSGFDPLLQLKRVYTDNQIIDLLNKVSKNDNSSMIDYAANGGEMIRRADGSYSRRGLWDNIRANKGSGKKPTKEMLEQERKIKSEQMKYGGTNNPGFEALPDYVQAKILSNMGYGGYFNPMMSDGGSTYSAGLWYANGGIAINPANKGKFTESADDADMGVQEFAAHVLANKDNYSSTMVKRANFARNAAKWKHKDGGELPFFQTMGQFNPMVSSTMDQENGVTTVNQQPLFGNPFMISDNDGTINSSRGFVTNQDTQALGYSDSGMHIKDAAKNLQNIFNTGSAKDIRQGIKSFNQDYGTNLKAPGMVIGQKSRQTMGKIGAFGAATQMGIGLASAATDAFINNPEIKRQNKKSQVLSSMTEPLNMAAPKDRGDWVSAGSRIGELRPDQYVVNKGMYTGEFYPSQNYAQIGGVIDQEINMPLESMYIPTVPTSNTKPAIAKTSVPEPAPLTLNSNFKDYAVKADRYIKSVNPKTDITGEMLAQGAQQAFEKYGKLVPVELALAQLQQEGYLAKGSKLNRPQRTRNPFNVGNTDNGSNVNHSNLQSGVNTYYELMAGHYLQKRSPDELLQNFVNSAGNRYASDKNYEKSLKNIIRQVQNRTYEEGGVYDLSEDEIRSILSAGGNVEFV